ncbi:hypothetical protein [Amphritea pacifica]|uniref:DUF2970 domain-containing protein n=1 Tax=Amphritea pacifica TaxID=2811233 RepID=A0ABS2WDB5_9GAMM|nr:hypothetical protein [Amphritea pacifica]MBN0989695.1 hypothetical protein [Amphritea pacifica]
MYPNLFSEKLLLLMSWIARILRSWSMVFTKPPDERERKYNIPMQSMWLGLLASAVFLIALISLLYWLLTTLAG